MEAEPGGLTYEFHKAGPPRPVANIATVGELRRGRLELPDQIILGGRSRSVG